MRVWSLGREDPLEEGMANPLQYSCLENPKDRGAWWATVHGVAKSQTWLKWLSTHARVMAAWVKTMRHITKAYDSWLTHQMSWVEGKGGFKEEQRKEGGREASSSSSIRQEACFLGAYPAGGWFLSPHCNPCIWGSLKNGSTCLFQNISGVVIVQNLLWVMKKRELSLTNSDYHHHPSHSPVIPNQFISIQPWNSSCYPVSISHLSFNSKFKNPVIPFTNEFFWFGSRIKVPWIRLLIFFFLQRMFQIWTFLPLHLTPTPCPPPWSRWGRQVYTAFVACPFPPPHSDSPYFQAPSFLMLPTATASNCFFHVHSRFPTRHCLQSPRRFKKCKSDYVAVCLKLLMTFPLLCSQIPPQGPYLARLRTSRGKGLELCSHLT